MIYSFGLLAMSLIVSGENLPRPGLMLVGDTYHLRPAGGAVNIAIAAKRAGAPAVALCAVVGQDEFGQKLVKHLQTQKLDLTHVITQQGATALMPYAVARGGQAQASLARGSAVALRAEPIAALTVAGDHVLVDVMANADESYALVKAAAAKGAATYLYYSHGAALPDDAVLGALSWLVTDSQGAEALAGQIFTEDNALVEWASAYGMKHQLHLVVQNSPAETLVFTFQGAWRWRGLKTEALDFTGAHEAWLGTLVTALAAGLPEQRALARAAAASSLSTLALGAQDAMVQNQTLAEWLPDLPEPERLELA